MAKVKVILVEET